MSLEDRSREYRLFIEEYLRSFYERFHDLPQKKLFEAMEKLNAIKVSAPVKCGQVICRDFIENGIDLIACKSVE